MSLKIKKFYYSESTGCFIRILEEKVVNIDDEPELRELILRMREQEKRK